MFLVKVILYNLIFDQNYDLRIFIFLGTCINSPIVYELDSSDLDKWNEKVLDKSKSIFKDYLDKFEKNNKVALNLRRHEIKDESKEIHVFNKCEVCDRIFVNKFQWECKIKSLN